MSFDENRILKVGRKIEHTYAYLEAIPFFKGIRLNVYVLAHI